MINNALNANSLRYNSTRSICKCSVYLNQIPFNTYEPFKRLQVIFKNNKNNENNSNTNNKNSLSSKTIVIIIIIAIVLTI